MLKGQLEKIQGEFSKERVSKIENELFIRKLLLLKKVWDNNEDVDNTTFKDVYNLYKEADNKLRNKNDEKSTIALTFIKNACRLCEEKLKEIKKISNVQTLYKYLKIKEKHYCGFVDLSTEIIKYKDDLNEQLKRE